MRKVLTLSVATCLLAGVAVAQTPAKPTQSTECHSCPTEHHRSEP